MNTLVNVADLLEDPDFAEEFDVIRNAVSYDHGNMNLTETTEKMVGVVQGPSGEELVRFPELANFQNVISIHTKGNLSAEQPNGYADIVVWQGARYVVKKLAEDYHNWGDGWVHAYATLMSPQNVTQPVLPTTGGP